MPRLTDALLAIAFAAACAIGVVFVTGVGRDLAAATLMEKSFAGTRAAPEFAAGLDWINTGGKPITLASLRGKVVLLDFWTYGCANCMHVIADLERLEQKYADSLVVIGVHSAKFANEGRTSQIRKVVQRYELKHPVVNDKAMAIWDAYGARAWPTLALVDPAGNAVGQVSGEGHYDTLDRVIGSLVAEFEAKGVLQRSRFPVTPDPLPQTTLLYPGKVLVDAPADGSRQRLFIADTLHHRIVVTDLAGRQLLTIGAGQKGFVDGALSVARFDAPQGLALADADTLYVADERNDSIRRVDLAKGTVSTVAGNGQHGYMRGGAYDARATTLNTPWDLLWRDGQLYIAMAGQHQLWRYDPRTQRLKLHAGSGYEQLEDGRLVDAGLNQPSGLTTDGKKIYFADSEASAIRSADFATDGALVTLVGTGLFDFGDIDGKGRAVRLQHPLGVSWSAGRLFIADTYNGKLKQLDPATLVVTTLAAGLDEPGGLSASAGKVYIADTNHHAIKVYDLATKRLTELKLQ